MIIVGSANAHVGMAAGWDILSRGGRALDAAEAVVRLVEDNPQDHTVGYAGYPNVLGQVELDASIMDGNGRRAGAVAALCGYRAAIAVARAVMERTQHVLIAGEGAARLAAEIGLEPENLLPDEIAQMWRERLAGEVELTGPLSDLARIAVDPEHVEGTVNVLAMDREGHIASAVSTSGWAWKYPGRVGDSAIIGAGNYADTRYGAAACTGWGELTIRASTARLVVAALAAGDDLEQACHRALHDLRSLADTQPQAMPVNIVALDAHGNHHAVSTRAGAQYVVQSDGMVQAEIRERTHVPIWDQ